MNSKPHIKFGFGLIVLLILMILFRETDWPLTNRSILAVVSFSLIVMGYWTARRFMQAQFRTNTTNVHFGISLLLAILILVVLPEIAYSGIGIPNEEKQGVVALQYQIKNKVNAIITVLVIAFLLLQLGWLGLLLSKRPNLLKE
jgi:hypothetical protein